MPREPLYPHVPKSKLRQPTTIWPPFQKFLDDVQASIKDERAGYYFYQGMSTTASELGMKEWASTLERMANDENRHRTSLEGILQEVEGLSLSTINLLAKTEGDPIRKFCCRLCGECAPPELLEEGRFPDRIAWLRSHYKSKHPGIWGKSNIGKLPQTTERGELIPPQYRDLVGWISEPLPREAE